MILVGIQNQLNWDRELADLRSTAAIALTCGIIRSLGLVKKQVSQQEAIEKLNTKLFDIYEGMWIQNHFKKFSSCLSPLSLSPLPQKNNSSPSLYCGCARRFWCHLLIGYRLAKCPIQSPKNISSHFGVVTSSGKKKLSCAKTRQSLLLEHLAIKKSNIRTPITEILILQLIWLVV